MVIMMLEVVGKICEVRDRRVRVSWLGSKASCSLVCFQILIWRLLCSPQIQLYFSYYILLLLVRPENSPPPPLQAISQDTRDFIQVSNTQESPRTVEKGTSS